MHAHTAWVMKPGAGASVILIEGPSMAQPIPDIYNACPTSSRKMEPWLYGRHPDPPSWCAYILQQWLYRSRFCCRTNRNCSYWPVLEHNTGPPQGSANDHSLDMPLAGAVVIHSKQVLWLQLAYTKCPRHQPVTVTMLCVGVLCATCSNCSLM